MVYDYRYLCVAGFAWNQAGPVGTQTKQAQANGLVPGLGVVIQDSLLLHARSLIEFYLKQKASDTDVVLEDFDGLVLPSANKAALELRKPAIDVHAMHITAWRDVDYRNAHGTTVAGAKRQRLDWNLDNNVIVADLLDALAAVAGLASTWQQPLNDLHDASVATLSDPSSPGWPPDLTEKADVDAYLTRLGL